MLYLTKSISNWHSCQSRMPLQTQNIGQSITGGLYIEISFNILVKYFASESVWL